MVLERASEDMEFSSQLAGDYPKALKDYNLTSEEGGGPWHRVCTSDRVS